MCVAAWLLNNTTIAWLQIQPGCYVALQNCVVAAKRFDLSVAVGYENLVDWPILVAAVDPTLVLGVPQVDLGEIN